MKQYIPLVLIALLGNVSLANAETPQKKLQVNTETSSAHDEHCRGESKKEIRSLFDRWNKSLQTGDPKQVLKNYANSSILLPTLSNKVRISNQEKLDYFEHFLAKKPVGKIELSSVELDCNTAFDAGIYQFTFGDGSTAKARYSYTYKWFPAVKEWLITSHHSSLMPEKVVESETGH
jgi:uncharacterized protein (TIGR02246 family)